MFIIDPDRGVPGATYLAELRYFHRTVRSLVERASPDVRYIEQLANRINEAEGPVYVPAMTEDWCGDSAYNLPILVPLFEEAGARLLVYHGSEYEELDRYYNESGDDHIPAVSVWNVRGEELARWIEQPGAITERKQTWQREHPRYMELYAVRESDRKAAAEFSSLYRQFVEAMAEWYVDGLWNETCREIVDSFERVPQEFPT